jgi:methylenetetrahydrofolate reductase (NADPH)
MDPTAEGVVPGLGRMTSTADSQSVVELLTHPRYEVIPLAGAEEEVLEHVPSEVTVTVTTSPKKGLDPTLDLVEQIAANGYSVVPHLAARHVRDRDHLAELVERIRAAGATDVLVMAGDAAEPAGVFDGALPLLEALAELGGPFENVGVTGYPESHGFLSDDVATRSLLAKAEFSTYIVTQICFDPAVTATWMDAVRARGIQLPIYVGLPGPVPRSKLLRVCERIGVGDSLRSLSAGDHEPDGAREDEFDPDPLVFGLDASFDGRQPNMAGFHVFTFNDLEGAERWRQGALGRLRNA